MPNNNPLGFNSYGGPFEHEDPYGAVNNLAKMTQAAPLATNPALNAPRRAQKQAARSGGAGLRPTPPAPPVRSQPSYEQQLAQFWTQLAQDPGASELVRSYAQEVAR